jgi:hypothetical protein
MIVAYVNRYNHMIKEMERNWGPCFLDHSCALMPLKSGVKPDPTPDEIVCGEMITV